MSRKLTLQFLFSPQLFINPVIFLCLRLDNKIPRVVSIANHFLRSIECREINNRGEGGDTDAHPASRARVTSQLVHKLDE